MESRRAKSTRCSWRIRRGCWPLRVELARLRLKPRRLLRQTCCKQVTRATSAVRLNALGVTDTEFIRWPDRGCPRRLPGYFLTSIIRRPGRNHLDRVHRAGRGADGAPQAMLGVRQYRVARVADLAFPRDRPDHARGTGLHTDVARDAYAQCPDRPRPARGLEMGDRLAVAVKDRPERANPAARAALDAQPRINDVQLPALAADRAGRAIARTQPAPSALLSNHKGHGATSGQAASRPRAARSSAGGRPAASQPMASQ